MNQIIKIRKNINNNFICRIKIMNCNKIKIINDTYTIITIIEITNQLHISKIFSQNYHHKLMLTMKIFTEKEQERK